MNSIADFSQLRSTSGNVRTSLPRPRGLSSRRAVGRAYPEEATLILGPAMFPTTRHSVIFAAGASDAGGRRSAFGTCVEVYWHPVRSYLRLRWHMSTEESE